VYSEDNSSQTLHDVILSLIGNADCLLVLGCLVKLVVFVNQ